MGIRIILYEQRSSTGRDVTQNNIEYRGEAESIAVLTPYDYVT